MRLHSDAEVMAKIKELVKAHDIYKAQAKQFEREKTE
jgi:hypothetical protein